MLVSIINLGEVYYRVGREQGSETAEKTVEELQRLGLTILSATNERVFSAANFKSHYRISYADAFAVASTAEVGGILVTGDPELIQLDGVIEVEVLARHRT